MEDHYSRKRAEAEKLVAEEQLRRRLRRFEAWGKKSDARIYVVKVAPFVLLIAIIFGIGAGLTAIVALITGQPFKRIWSHDGEGLTTIGFFIVVVVAVIVVVRSANTPSK